MKKEFAAIRILLKNKDNRVWLYKNWGGNLFAYFTAFVSAWSLLEVFGVNLTNFVDGILPGSSIAVMVIAFLVCAVITGRSSLKEMKSFSHLRVETERSGCSVEIRVADSYLTNAFDNYPNCSMIIGSNKAFWFQEAEPGSLVADMWKLLQEKGITKEEVQRKIDEALEALWSKNPDLKAQYIDPARPKVCVKTSAGTKDPVCPNHDCPFSCVISEADKGTEVYTVCRDNYKIGTVIGVDLSWTEPGKDELQKLRKIIPHAIVSAVKRMKFNISAAANDLLGIETPPGREAQKPMGFRDYLKENRYKTVPPKPMVKKLYLIANSEVVQGFDMNEPMKVTFDRDASVVENFPRIWEYFEAEEERSPMPPKHIMYQSLLIPLIGAGVANEGYSDLEIFSKIVDLYYEHLRKSIRAGKHPVIPNLIINIQSKTAIELNGAEDGSSRKIDLVTAFDYLKYRNKVNPVVSKE